MVNYTPNTLFQGLASRFLHERCFEDVSRSLLLEGPADISSVDGVSPEAPFLKYHAEADAFDTLIGLSVLLVAFTIQIFGDTTRSLGCGCFPPKFFFSCCSSATLNPKPNEIFASIYGHIACSIFGAC